MSGPACVADSSRGGRQRVGAQELLEVGQLAGLLADLQLPFADDRDPGRVIAAVLQSTQARHHDLQRLLLADVTHDAAHGSQRTRAQCPP